MLPAPDQVNTGIMRMIPALILPFRMIRAKCLVLLTLPAITSFNPVILVEGNRRNLLRLWLRAEVRVLRFDLLHLLRVRLLRLGPRIRLCVLLADCRSCAGFGRGLLHTLTLLPLLSVLLLGGSQSICSFTARLSPSGFSSTRLIRRSRSRLT